ncbi:MAG: endopeptidase La, partial [Muribaculaceae bacterium]|nr:endopeptidase La [Muribaculaceae bacterium]
DIHTTVGHLEISGGEFKAAFSPSDVPVLPTRNLVLFPGVTYPINIVRESSLKLVEKAGQLNIALAVVCQKDPDNENPGIDDIEQYGVLIQVLKVLPLPDDSSLAIVQAGKKVKITGPDEGHVIENALAASVETVTESKPRAGKPLEMLIDALKQAVASATKRAGHPLGQMMFDNVIYTQNPQLAINSVATSVPFDTKDKVAMLSLNSTKARCEKLLELFAVMEQREKMVASLRQRAGEAMDARRRNAFLESEMEIIRQELYGDADEETDTLRRKIDQIAWPDEATRSRIEREMRKISRLNPQSPDYQVQLSYLETVLDLPWGICGDQEPIDMEKAERLLNENHYGLTKVKERVLEQLALLEHAPSGRAPILCLVGPPGVGKTSLGQSIADAMNRKFQRVSLGGLHDESEIRGHRRTYIGAMPGRILEAIRRAGTLDPVIMLDEIDKVGADYKGDPAAALLELLDPEQNCRFHDNYIDIDFDLSKVTFITTANTLSTLSQPLLDRMEVVSLSGYSAEEKTEIAKRHIYPRLLADMGLRDSDISFTDEALLAIIQDYTSESGVRRLQKQIAAAMRKCVRAIAARQPFDPIVTPERLHDLLGVAPMSRDRFGTDGMPGVVTGLAWTAAGGEVLYIEALASKGKGDQLSLTGNLGDVMKESASIARRYVMAHAEELGINQEAIAERDLHIHVPEGAIPKDGPSAGITMATAIASALSGRPVRQAVAMTGELTLRGRVLPVGGIKEKMLAARRAGVKEIYISEDNRRNVEEIDEVYRRDLTFHFVTTVTEVIKGALGI